MGPRAGQSRPGLGAHPGAARWCDRQAEEQGYQAARLAGLAILASLRRELGDFDRITVWLRVFGQVNATPDFDRYALVINGFSDLIIGLFGAERGAHARSVVHTSALPFGAPVEIEAEVEIKT